MSDIVQICIVIATIALVVLTTTLLMVLKTLERMSRPLLRAIQAANGHAEQLATDTRELLRTLHALTEPAGDVWERVHQAVARLETLTTSVVDQIEEPVQVSVALLRGVRTGTKRFMELLMGRMMGNTTPNKGVESHDRWHG